MSEADSNTIEKQHVQRRASTGSFGPPTAIIIIVATIVFFVVNGPQSNASNRQRLTTESSFSSTAILAGIERNNSSQAFHSAEASAVLGGDKLDFREAIMEGDEA